MKIRFMNLTPHAVNVGLKTIPPSGKIARVVTTEKILGEVDGITILHQENGEVENLPKPEKDTIYIVSFQTLLACPERSDLAVPHGLIRNKDGVVIGCESLSVNKNFDRFTKEFQNEGN